MAQKEITIALPKKRIYVRVDDVEMVLDHLRVCLCDNDSLVVDLRCVKAYVVNTGGPEGGNSTPEPMKHPTSLVKQSQGCMTPPPA
jgi:hypothetical protein